MSEYVVKLTDGTVVECKTPDQVRALVGKLAGQIAKAGPGSAGSAPPAPKKQKKRPRNFRSPGIGPKKLWSMAMYHSVLTKQSKNDARTELSKLKKSDARAFLDKEETHSEFVAWYAKKAKKSNAIEAMDALQIVFDEDHEKFVTLVEEFSKRPKKPAGRRRAG